MKSNIISRLLFQRRKTNSGFTLTELLVALTIGGTLGALSLSGWSGFISKQKLNETNDKVYLAIAEAQTKAKKKHKKYTVAFRTDSDKTLQYSILPTNTTPSSNDWKELSDKKNSLQLTPANAQFSFDHKGRFESNNANNKIVVNSALNDSQRCIKVGDLLGNVMKLKDSDCKS